jgi:5,10-methylenetetrahydromethanopterin reductase
VEFWTPLFEDVEEVPRLAVEREEQGWDGLTFGDTQFYMADPYVMMTAAAMETSRVLLATSVTNPVTRDSSVTAAAIASVHRLSGGRAVLGIGRGDSALFYVGQRPVTTRRLEDDVLRIRALVRGDEVPITENGSVGGARTARLSWVTAAEPPPAIDVHATGPRTIAVGARHADRVTLSVGAETERIRWGMGVAARAGRRTPLPPLRVGVSVTVAPHHDIGVSRRMVSGYAATHARFAAMNGRPAAWVPAGDAAEITRLGKAYDMSRHGGAGAGHAAALSAGFLDRFAVVGTPDDCVERLRGLLELGLSHMLLIPPGREDTGPEREESLRLLNEAVLPALRKAAGSTSSEAR